MKVDRDYVLTVGVGPYSPPVATDGPTKGISYATNQISVRPPLKIEFDVRREFLGTANTATIRLTNLKEQSRDAIYKDRYAVTLFAPVSLRAGYRGAFLSTIFNGTVMVAASYRSRQDEIVTEIEAQDYGIAYANSYTSTTLAPNLPFQDANKNTPGVISRLNSDLIGVSSTPIVGTVPGTLGPRPTVAVGPTLSTLQKMLPVGVTASIDNGQLKVLADTDVIGFGDKVFVISSATGLLDPPVREGTMVTCRMLFEPRITIGQIVELRSIDNAIYNRTYQVRGVSHFGIISDAEAGPCYTTLQLYLGPTNLNLLKGAISIR